MEYAYAGAHALVQLHERHLRAFVVAWKAAVADGVALPPSDDPTCASLGALLHHVLGAARGYMVWICRNLGLEDPGIRDVPADVEADLDGYVEHLLESWEGPLVHLDQRTADLTHFPASWGPPYCVDAMLEHAVMHPIRHAFQLERARCGT
jgi:hypothetical protein